MCYPVRKDPLTGDSSVLIFRTVSDDGGSSSEILRCLGGPSIGDIRSRLIRLIPVPENGVMDLVNDPGSRLDGIQAVHDLFAQRFPATGTERQVKEMWGDIIEGTSDLWTGIPEDRREAMRGARSSRKPKKKSL